MSLLCVDVCVCLCYLFVQLLWNTHKFGHTYTKLARVHCIPKPQIVHVILFILILKRFFRCKTGSVVWYLTHTNFSYLWLGLKPYGHKHNTLLYMKTNAHKQAHPIIMLNLTLQYHHLNWIYFFLWLVYCWYFCFISSQRSMQSCNIISTHYMYSIANKCKL